MADGTVIGRPSGSLENNPNAIIWDEPPDDYEIDPNSVGMKQLSPEELNAQVAAMDALKKEWRNVRLDNEYENSRLLGFTKQAEIWNGRSAMFFIVVALVTEAVTGDSIPDQVFLLLQTLGIIGLDGF
eukprot:CAMPEP_0185767556 /NCGR_PEP_ID=MMETSP1174-20130828/44808_1 /TAXON_ID=35687 /ORGANISM="Dictyocha speculum, Strain CCMP1381" /LENGTH=127 /DNA_ID=CAMNT_0028451833 /DNA_START=162 /DNA_END=545 /DNA_ORIENTATION=+